MNIKFRLIILVFLQFFIWGSWMITVANYWFITKQWSSVQFGAIFSTMGIASIFMPTLCGIIADRWLKAEKLYVILHIFAGITLISVPWVNDPGTFFWVILLAMLFYMPTISLSYSICYSILQKNNLDIIKEFPPIRVWGTLGFIVAMWITNLTGNKASANQFYIAGITAFILGLYALSLPSYSIEKKQQEKKTWVQVLGLDAFALFKNRQIALFLFFGMLLGAALQLTNAYGDTFLSNFGMYGAYQNSWVVKYSTIIMSISQVSETLFILAIPFFLKKFGIKIVMLISMVAWVLRFGLFAFGNPADGLWMLVLSCIVYGMAFDFFSVSGSLFIDTSVDEKLRYSSQGLFMMVTNGFGAVLGSLISGYIIQKYFTLEFTNINSLLDYFHSSLSNPSIQNLVSDNPILNNGNLQHPIAIKEWKPIWLCFSAYALVVTILFAILFKYKKEVKKHS